MPIAHVTAQGNTKQALARMLGRCITDLAGKVTGTSGAKIGNAHLKWAYSEAAVLFLQRNPRGQRPICRLRSKHGKGKALSILAARLGRASYFMLRRSTAFDMDRFVMN